MIYTTYVHSSFGIFEIKGTNKGLRTLRMVQESGKASDNVPVILQNVVTQLEEYFQRKRKEFNVALDWEGTSEFNQKVWQALLEIPYGHTTSYSAIAKKVGSPKASQAVGLANKNNKIAIIVPCHRVIAKNGDLHGYFYGLEMKRKLLELENPREYGKQGSLF